MKHMATQQLEDGFVRTKPNLARNLKWNAPFDWLSAGWSDLWLNSFASFVYGVFIFLLSVSVTYLLFELNVSYLLLSALAGFMIMGPALAVGLYEKSRRIAEGKKITFGKMLGVKGKTFSQILFVGVVLGLIMSLWLRAAFLLYALFFGMVPFSGFDQIITTVFTTNTGWALLLVGSAVGGLFAAFSFAISAFSIPMLLNEKTDAFTAMGTSMALTWNNMKIAIIWGAIVLCLFLVCLLTGLVGLIIIFPLLGHSTWHAYEDIRFDIVKSEP